MEIVMNRAPSVMTVKAYMGKCSVSGIPALAGKNAITAVATPRGIIAEMSTRSLNFQLLVAPPSAKVDTTRTPKTIAKSASPQAAMV